MHYPYKLHDKFTYFVKKLTHKTDYNTFLGVMVVLLMSISSSFAQISDSIPLLDSLDIGVDSLHLDSIHHEVLDVNISKDALNDPVEYDARDSMIYDIDGKKIHLYGEASVKYTTLSITGDYIIFDYDKNEVIASYSIDSLHHKHGIPQFQDGDQKFSADSMRYNFITRKGIVYDVTSQYNDMYIHGSKAKFISKDTTKTDRADDIIYSKNAIFTTCDATEPHFGIRSKKQKMIPDKVVIVGPSNLEIMGIPTPLWLPFGLYPISKERHQGIRFPEEYGYENRRGSYGLRGLGYYYPINDRLDAQLTGNIYFNGSWGLNFVSNYKKRYKYTGQIGFGYARNIFSLKGIPDTSNSFKIHWQHGQDRTANPLTNLSGSVNIETNGFQKINYDDANSVLRNQLSSSINFSKRFRNHPTWNFTASMRHTQIVSTHELTLDLPTLSFTTGSLTPFKRKERIGEEKWYEDISFTSSTDATNKFRTTDTTLFTKKTLNAAQYGLKERISINKSFQILKYFSLVPNFSYTGVFVPRTIEKVFVPKLEIEQDTMYNIDSSDYFLRQDTISYGKNVNQNELTWSSFHALNTGVSLNTKLYGTWQKSHGFFRGIRHVISPSLSFNYSPEGAAESYIKQLYFQNNQGDLDTLDYTIFEESVYGRPSEQGKQKALSLSIGNTIEGKYFSKKDSLDKKFSILKTLSFSSGYNFAADSFQIGNLSLRGRTNLFKGLTTLTFGSDWSAYGVDDAHKITKELYYEQTGKLARYLGTHVRFSTTINQRSIKQLFKKDNEANKKKKNASINKEDDLFEIIKGFTITHNFNLQFGTSQNPDTFYISQNSLTIKGNIPLTDKWSITLSNITYDFKLNKLVYPDVGFHRDLHCWEMGMNWRPSRQSYSFYLRVIPSSTFSFLKIPWEKRSGNGYVPL